MAEDKLLSLVSSKMNYLGQRQTVLAQNIANADTPGYKPRDLAPFTFADALKQTQQQMATTNVAHIVPASMAGANAKTKNMKSFETMPSGNAVELEQQAMQVSKTAVDYQGVAAVYKKITGWFKTALGRSSA